MLRLAHVMVDLGRGEVLRGADAIPLTDLEARLLAYMSARTGQVVSRAALEREVWGLRSGVRTEAVPVLIRRLRKKLELDPGRPVSLVTRHGAGWVLRRARLPSLEGFVGRRDALAQVERSFEAGDRWVVVHGMGGMGKTTLARCAAIRFEGEVLNAELQALSDEEAVCRVVARACELGGAPSVTQLGRALRARGPTLLVLENLEFLVDPGLKPARAWLEAAPELYLLGTSRRPLPGAACLPLGPLEPAAARALIRFKARQVPGAPEVPEPIADRLAASLGCIPLALVLGAARLSVFSPEELLRRVDRQLPLLSARGGRVGMGEIIEWTWDQLSDAERQTLAAAASFRRPCGLGELAAVDGLGEGGVTERVAALARLGLLVRLGERVTTFDVLREFVAGRLGPRVSVRHMAYFHRLAARWADPAVPWDALPEALAASTEDLKRALSVAVDEGLPDVAAELALALDRLEDAAAPPRARLVPLRAARALDPAPPLALRLGLREVKALGWIDVTSAQDMARALLAEAERSGEPTLEAQAALGLVEQLTRRARLDEVGVWVRRAVALAEDSGQAWLRQEAQWRLSGHLRMAGDLDMAVTAAERVLALQAQWPDPLRAARTQSLLARVHILRGAPHLAIPLLERALAVLSPRHARDAAFALYMLGVCQLNLRRFADASASCERLADLSLRSGALANKADAHSLRGGIARIEGEVEVARAEALRFLRVAEEVGDARRVLYARAHLAYADWMDGELVRAARALDAVVAGCDALGDPTARWTVWLVARCCDLEREAPGESASPVAALPPERADDNQMMLAVMTAWVEGWGDPVSARAALPALREQAAQPQASDEGLLALRRFEGWLGAR